jgi:hypothetical protein
MPDYAALAPALVCLTPVVLQLAVVKRLQGYLALTWRFQDGSTQQTSRWVAVYMYMYAQWYLIGLHVMCI